MRGGEGAREEGRSRKGATRSRGGRDIELEGGREGGRQRDRDGEMEENVAQCFCFGVFEV